MSPLNRTLPAGWASLQRWYSDNFDTAEKVVVYWPDTTPTLVAYYSSVSAANAGATANINGQRKPRVLINWWHSDITQYPVGPHSHPRANDADGAISLPSWIDEEPAS